MRFTSSRKRAPIVETTGSTWVSRCTRHLYSFDGKTCTGYVVDYVLNGSTKDDKDVHTDWSVVLTPEEARKFAAEVIASEFKVRQ